MYATHVINVLPLRVYKTIGSHLNHEIASSKAYTSSGVDKIYVLPTISNTVNLIGYLSQYDTVRV